LSYDVEETMKRKVPVGSIEHVGVVMRDLDGARRLFHETLRLPIAEYPGKADSSAFAVKAGNTVIRVTGTESNEAKHGRTGVSHVAVRVDSFKEAAGRCKDAGITFAPDETGSNGRRAMWSDPKTSLGIPLQFVEQGVELKFQAPNSPSIVERIDHLGIACHSGQVASTIYVDGLGWPLECTQTDSEFLIPMEITSNDKYGVTSRAGTPIPTIGSGLIALFIWTGEFDLEVMQPLGPAKLRAPLGSIPGSVGQDQGAIARALEARGEGLLHICFKTPDIRGAIKAVKDRGVKMIDNEPRPGARGSKIAFMDRRTTDGILLHFVERTPVD
jgi:catechol 2,3-dioxygenase-like lactoylglutathione lyase family enzyme